ncbi:hypothetical protein Sste5346_002087 [Sporothrix stenoceras]|uniref:Carbonic anhydrase n=1 Tax=Sporothrix stenoceras TaxID=5173 RepID=A0ABR3ZLH8_9PEZI
MAVSVADLLERNKTIEHSPAFYVSELQAANWEGISTLIVFVHRNMGGSVKTALRDIVTADTLFPTLKEICIIHHTDCGTTHVKEAAVKQHIKNTTKEDADIDIYTITGSIEESIQADLEWVRNSPYLREELKKNAQGFFYDIKTGLVTKVEPKIPL